MNKTKLELTWIGKDKRPKLEPRILLENPSKSYHASHKISDDDIFDNKLIFGDNLLALKALEQEYTGKIKCVYIDPPYNTGSAFDQYDDGLEHSIWLSLLRERLIVLRNLLSEDGSIWVSIDDNEMAYLKVMLDEIFGRNNFVASIIWEKRKTRENRRVFSFKHDYILLFARDKTKFDSIRNALPITDEIRSRYRNPDDDPRGDWQSISALAQAGHGTKSQFYTLTTPSGRKVDPPKGNCWRYSEKRMSQEVIDNRIWFGKSGENSPRIKKFLSESADKGVTPETLWYADDVGTTDSAKKHINEIFEKQLTFDTPKPEELIERIIRIATNPGELVLDSFSGSGTTGAVAQKIKRSWIMIELEETCHTHIIPRLKKVIDGKEQGGISKTMNWQGGGGFRYYSLAPSLLEQDKWNNWVINKDYNSAMLAEAICKLESFTYAPSDTEWWNHGYSTETDFITVTTQNLSVEKLEQLSEEVGSDRTLLVCCAAFRCKPDRFSNLTIKKIPKMVLSRCEWAHDDYSLNVQNLPMAEPDIADSLSEQDDLF
jgi:adenine-specific DNA-methyltransferase